MHRLVAGTCRMDLELTPQSPWMVRGEVRGQNPEVIHPLQYGPHTNDGPTYPPVLPASSIKGVLRSTAEYILRSIHADRSENSRPLADVPFVQDKKREAKGSKQSRPNQAPEHDHLQGLARGQIADSELLEWNAANGNPLDTNALAPQRRYPLLSATTQLFGATVHAGLLTLDDAMTPSAITLRTHVALSRFTGGVGQGPFTERVVLPEGSLHTTLTVTNFALWQLALLGLVFREVSRGYVGFGSGTRKGQGRMQIKVREMRFSYPAKVYPAERVGIVSAQAHHPLATDVPDSVRSIEAPLDMLRDAPALETPTPHWREQDTVQRIVPDSLCETFFAEVVQSAWGPWVQAMRKE